MACLLCTQYYGAERVFLACPFLLRMLLSPHLIVEVDLGDFPLSAPSYLREPH